MQGSGPQSPLIQGPMTPGPLSPGKTPPYEIKSIPQSPLKQGPVTPGPLSPGKTQPHGIKPGPMSPPGCSNPESVQGAQSILTQQMAKLNLSGVESSRLIWDR